MFISPEGNGIYPIGINHLKVVFGKNNKSGHCEADVKNDIITHMENWGFNCGGYGTGAKLINKGFYYIGNLNLV